MVLRWIWNGVSSRRGRVGLFDFLMCWIRNRSMIKLEKERCDATIRILGQLPPGAEYQERVGNCSRAIRIPGVTRTPQSPIPELHHEAAGDPHYSMMLPRDAGSPRAEERYRARNSRWS